MKTLLFIFIVIFPFWTSQRASFVNFFLESGTGRGTVAFQQTGQKGMVSFEYLDAGSYYLLVKFPQQRGKWIEENPRQSTMTKAAYDPGKKTYYYQGTEGYFSIKFSGLRKIDSENFRPVFSEIRSEDGTKINVVQFQTHKKNGRIKIRVKKLTAAQFKRKAEKAEHDISTLSIRGIK